MAPIIDFYFEFSSPYGYLASTRIEQLADETGRELRWHPILLGPMFKAMGSAPLVQIPLKGQYALRDFKRSALLAGIPYNQPEPFPIATVAAARAALHALTNHPEKAAGLIKALYRAYFVDGRRIDLPETVLEVAKENGLDPGEVEAGISSQAIKTALKAEVDEAMARGVFGSPFIIVDDEPFWGFDRLDHVRQWIRLRRPAGEPARHE
jgi:2-hydroxychromene-2-carboxylate isomerase